MKEQRSIKKRGDSVLSSVSGSTPPPHGAPSVDVEDPEREKLVLDNHHHHTMTNHAADMQQWRTLAVSVIVFVLGQYLPKYILSLDDSFVSRPVPYQRLSSSGEIVLDMTLNYELVDPPTISGSFLLLTCTWMPLLLLLLCERTRRHTCTLSAFLVAIGSTEALTQIVKHFVKRRRPNFYALCQLVETACTNQHTIKEAQLSFPSGHSSLSMCACVFLYLYGRYQWNYPPSLICILLYSVFVGCTRLVDHWHHHSDVLAGWILGSVIAVVVFRGFGLERNASIHSNNNKNLESP